MDIGISEAEFEALCEQFKLQRIELKGSYFSTSRQIGWHGRVGN